MFSSINFLFLISLAVTTWIILCYFKQIELQREEKMTVEVKMDNTFEENLKPHVCLGNYDIYLNFLGVFACIYALAKVASLAESYVAHHVHTRFKHGKLYASRHVVEPTTIDEYRIQHLQLTMQNDNLEKQNANLEQKVKQLEQMNFMMGGKGHVYGAVPNCASKLGQSNDVNSKKEGINNKSLPQVIPQACVCGGANSVPSAVCNGAAAVNGRVEGAAKEIPAAVGGVIRFRNMLIQDRHYQLTRQVYVNDGNLKLQFQDFHQEVGSIPQIWQKYLEMQKYAVQKPTRLETPAEVANSMPIVVSTEELQWLKGSTAQQRGKRQQQPTQYPTTNSMATATTQTHIHHTAQTKIALPMQVSYKNVLVCLLCWYL
ncbi:PREDICTED: uncharacterized protein LOC108367051 [Rhagoletis zephyria]|uniref:uncharacterized protein LOC108367051 n=1 Tax=Rhagoletis zephyria TaxID=28612 RepID=UPI0008113BB7|nr:PREDICTED: uncharacterized protein LOC108367051 [Rhagoletis zephyria]